MKLEEGADTDYGDMVRRVGTDAVHGLGEPGVEGPSCLLSHHDAGTE